MYSEPHISTPHCSSTDTFSLQRQTEFGYDLVQYEHQQYPFQWLNTGLEIIPEYLPMDVSSSNYPPFASQTMSHAQDLPNAQTHQHDAYAIRASQDQFYEGAYHDDSCNQTSTEPTTFDPEDEMAACFGVEGLPYPGKLRVLNGAQQWAHPAVYPSDDRIVYDQLSHHHDRTYCISTDSELIRVNEPVSTPSPPVHSLISIGPVSPSKLNLEDPPPRIVPSHPLPKKTRPRSSSRRPSKNTEHPPIVPPQLWATQQRRDDSTPPAESPAVIQHAPYSDAHVPLGTQHVFDAALNTVSTPAPPYKTPVFPQANKHNHLPSGQERRHQLAYVGFPTDANGNGGFLQDGNTSIWLANPEPTPKPNAVSKKVTEKKQTLACLFCRERKIACGRPPEGSEDATCNQCVKRHIECTYPAESRRGQHRRTRQQAASHDVNEAS